MNKKKIIIAFVIFIFLGLTIFTFANPAEDENQNPSGNNNNIEEVNKENNNNNSVNNNENSSNNTNNGTISNGVKPVGSINDDSYDVALKAVISAEEKLENNSYNEALALVNKVTNEEQKNNLKKRLDEVKKIIDVKELVETLELKTTIAANKIDMTDARNYRAEKKIESLVASLTDKTLKNTLQEKLAVLSKLLDDTTNPIVNIEDGAMLSKNTTITVEDDNEVIIKLSKNNGESIEIENNTEVTEGSYTLTVIDSAFNEITISFTIDTIAPEVNLFDDKNNTLQNGDATKKEVKAIITDNSGSYTATLIDQNGNSREYMSDTFVGRGNWTLIVKDISGNTTTVTFKVDKDYPLVYLNSEKNEKVNTVVKYFNRDITLKVSDLNLDNVVLAKDENEISYSNEMILTEEGKYVVTAIDVVGNKTQVTFVIDKTNPVLMVKDDTIGTAPYFKRVSFKLYDNNAFDYYVVNGTKVDVSNNTWGDANYDNIKALLKVGKNTIELYDVAGNKTEQTFYYKYLISNFEELQEAFSTGGEVKLISDIVVSAQLVLPKGNNFTLDMNGKKLTLSKDVKLDTIDPMMDIKSGSKITITGNGTFDLEDNYSASFMYPRGDVIIENGNFLRDAGGTGYGSYFVGINGGTGKLIIYDGYFDGGSYKENSDEFDNSRDLLNASWGQYIRVYGGTFVGQNPAYGDEGMAFTNPNRFQTNYCQGLFFEGQKREDTEIPEDYTVIEGTHADGRPTYTVVYTGDI